MNRFIEEIRDLNGVQIEMSQFDLIFFFSEYHYWILISTNLHPFIDIGIIRKYKRAFF